MNPTYEPVGHIAIGDSITSARNSWANKLRDIDGVAGLSDQPFFIDAHSGRSILTYEPARDFTGLNDYGTVLFAAGMADLIFPSAIDAVKFQLGRHIDHFQRLGYDFKLLLAPGCLAVSDRSEAYRLAYTQVATDRGAEVHDLLDVWDFNALFDGLHPNETLQQSIADWVLTKVLGFDDKGS